MLDGRRSVSDKVTLFSSKPHSQELLWN